MANSQLDSTPQFKVNRKVLLCAIGIAFVIVGLIAVISFKEMRWVGLVILAIGAAMIYPLYKDFKGAKSNNGPGQIVH